MKIVADTNIFLAVALNEPHKKEIISNTNEVSLIAPSILPYKIGNALSAMVKRQQVTKDEVLRIFEATKAIPVRLLDLDIPSALEIALEFNIYAYDGYFLQCAQQMACPLYTMDKKMQNIAKQLRIPLIGV